MTDKNVRRAPFFGHLSWARKKGEKRKLGVAFRLVRQTTLFRAYGIIIHGRARSVVMSML